jgi:hypothetical protein
MVAGCTSQFVQSLSSECKYRRYSPELIDDCRPTASLHAETLVEQAFLTSVTSSQGPGYFAAAESFDRASAEQASGKRAKIIRRRQDDNLMRITAAPA